MPGCEHRVVFPFDENRGGSRSPGIYPFTAAGRRYFYDYGAGQIVQVGAAVFAHLCGDEEVPGAAETVAELRAHGLLQRPHNERIVPPLCAHCAEDACGASVEHLCLEVTEVCNLRCRYCAYSGMYPHNRSHGQAMMSWETARAAVDYYVARCGTVADPTISFYGGEPLLNFEIVRRVVHYVREDLGLEGIRFAIETNATLAADHHLEFLIANDFALQVSLDGPAAVHDANRVFADGRGSFDRVATALGRLFAMSEQYFSENVLVVCTLTPPYPVRAIEAFLGSHPYNLLTVVAGFVDAEGVDLESLVGRPDDQAAWAELLAFRDDYLNLMCTGRRDEVGPLARALFDQELVELFVRMPGKADGRIPCNGICVPGGRKLFVARDGTLHPCEKVGNDFPIGHVDSGLNRIRVQEYIDEYRGLCEELCRDCWAARLCRQCLVSVRRGGGISRERKLESCRAERHYWHNALTRAAAILAACPESLAFVSEVRVI